jgi:Flp pilus assembly pilin Flp
MALTIAISGNFENSVAMSGISPTSARPPLRDSEWLRRVAPQLAAARDAVTTIEYALIGLFIMVAIAGGVSGYGGSLGNYMAAAFGAIAASM